VSRGVAVMRYDWYTNGVWFDSNVADLTFFYLVFSGLHVTFRDSVRVMLAYDYISVRIG